MGGQTASGLQQFGRYGTPFGTQAWGRLQAAHSHETSSSEAGARELGAGQFKCYFMMNPEQISVTTGINTSQLSPFLQDPTQLWKSGGYGVSNQTVTFTVYFNRMYEVWQGDTHNPLGGPGPSDEGCRWDTRALERLMGVFDAVSTNGQDTGLGNSGWGGNPASMIPLQIVFGGKNALRFQGVMAGFDYTFTLFDANMIPIEAYADISIMRVVQPRRVFDLTVVGQLQNQTTATPTPSPCRTKRLMPDLVLRTQPVHRLSGTLHGSMIVKWARAYMGQSLVMTVPLDAQGDSAAAVFGPPAQFPATFSYYTVLAGDRMDTIANRTLRSCQTLWWKIANANPEIFYPDGLVVGFDHLGFRHS